MKNNLIFKLSIICLFFAKMTFAQLYPVTKVSGGYDFMYGYINNLGKLYAPYNYTSANTFSDSLGVVSNKEEKYGFVNQFGREAIVPKYNYAYDFHNGYAMVEQDEKQFLIDKKDTKYQIDNIDFTARNYFSQDLIIIKVDGKKGYANLKNKVIIAPKYDIATPFSDGIAIAINEKLIYFLDQSGKEIKTDYIDACRNVGGFIPVKNSNNKWGVINTQMQTIVDFKYDYINEFTNGYTTFQEGNKYGMFNTKGEIFVPAQYYYVNKFSENRIVLQINGNTISIVDENLKEIKRFDNMSSQYGEDIYFKNGICKIMVDVVDPNSKVENIRNYGGLAFWYINKSGDVIFKDEAFYSCFPENSLVKMSDNSSKNIQDIKEGDEVMTFNKEKGINESSQVLKLEVHEGQFNLIQIKVAQTSNSTCSLLENEFIAIQSLVATPNHPILTKLGVKRMDQITKDDILFVWNDSSQSFEELKVISKENIAKTNKVYNLKTVSPNYIVNSTVVMVK